MLLALVAQAFYQGQMGVSVDDECMGKGPTRDYWAAPLLITQQLSSKLRGRQQLTMPAVIHDQAPLTTTFALTSAAYESR